MSSFWWRIPIFVVLVLATVSLGACVNIQVIDRSATVPDTASDGGNAPVAEHDLAVLAVDFDPPLEYEQILARKNRGEGITLLVAVENTGVHPEQDIFVAVQLTERDGDAVYLHKQGSIESISPGEIKIVQFRDTDIPFAYAYSLHVSVDPVSGETQLSDNVKTYDLLITRP
jgi:hypothetical protein